MVEAESVCNRIILLDNGRIIADSDPIKLRQQFDTGSRISWVDEFGNYHEKWTFEPLNVLRGLLEKPIRDLEVRRNSLEEIYLDIVSHGNGVERD